VEAPLRGIIHTQGEPTLSVKMQSKDAESLTQHWHHPHTSSLPPPPPLSSHAEALNILGAQLRLSGRQVEDVRGDWVAALEDLFPQVRLPSPPLLHSTPLLCW